MTASGGESSAAGVRWDLSRAFADVEEARASLADAVDRAERLRDDAARVPELDATGVRRVLDDASALAELRDALDCSYGYPGLRLQADAGDDAARDLAADCEVALVGVRDALRSVEVAVGARPEIAASEALRPYGHWVEHQAARASHRLGDEAELALAARDATAADAWGRLSQEILTTASTTIDLGDGPRAVGVVELRQLRYHRDRDTRRRALIALHGVYREQLLVSASCLDAAVADRVAEDRLRGRGDAMEATLVVDEVDRQTVEAVLETTEARTDVLERWYERKRATLGLETIEACDRFGAVGAGEPSVAWRDAVETCVAALDALSPGLGDVARDVVDGRQVDAELRPGKSGAIFSATLPGDRGNYVFLNYLDTAKGAVDLAHELGHAAHFGVAKRALPWLVAVEPASAAFFEVPSTLAELVVAERLADEIGGERGKAALRAALETSIALLYDAAVMTRFEQDVCAARAGGAALTSARLEEAWTARDVAVNGPLSESLGFMHWPHPYEARFYAYQYTYASLAALCLSALRRESPDRFAREYRAMLAATGTGTPAELLAMCGLDVADPGVWQQGFDELARLCDSAW